MSVIVPCVTVNNSDAYKSAMQKIHKFSKRVHVDFSDNTIAPLQSISVDQIWWPQEWQVDIHAMVSDPGAYVDSMLALKPHLIIFHAEVNIDLLPVIQKIKMNGSKAGVALMRPTVPADVAHLIEAADHVMVFSGNLGEYGGTASLMQLEKVRLIKNINAGAEIGWDGGIAIENAFSLAQGGIDVMYVGHAIQEVDDAQAAYEALVKEVNRQGAV